MSKVIYSKKAMNDVDWAISQAHESYQTTRKKVQVAAVSVLLHAYNHGDYSKAATLVDGLKGLNQNALVEFFVKFGGLIVTEGEGFTGWNGKEHIKEQSETAKATMWWDLRVQNPYQGFNLQAEVLKLVAKAEKAVETANKDAEKAEKIDVQADQLAALRSLSA